MGRGGCAPSVRPVKVRDWGVEGSVCEGVRGGMRGKRVNEEAKGGGRRREGGWGGDGGDGLAVDEYGDCGREGEGRIKREACRI